MITSSELTTLRRICEAIEAGYDAEKTMLDDDMVPHAQDLCDQTETIRNLITAYEAEKEREPKDPHDARRLAESGLRAAVEQARCAVGTLLDLDAKEWAAHSGDAAALCYLMDISRSNAATWSGGSHNPSNVFEVIVREAALNLAQVYRNRVMRKVEEAR